jgi:hypothetical protein
VVPVASKNTDKGATPLTLEVLTDIVIGPALSPVDAEPEDPVLPQLIDNNG